MVEATCEAWSSPLARHWWSNSTRCLAHRAAEPRAVLASFRTAAKLDGDGGGGDKSFVDRL
eukprot:166028-Pleurochrysis_carterae.AAC.1